MTTPPATPPAAQTREPGFYWVRYTTSLVNTDWFVAELRNDAWWPTGEDIACAPDEIGPRIPSFAERPGDAALGERLRALRAKATPGPWSVATYCLRPGSPDQIERGLLMYGDDEGDDVSPTGVIDEKDMPGIGEESVSHDLDLIAELVNNLDAILAALTPSAPGSGTGWRDISTAPKSTAIAMQHGSFVRGVYLLGYCPEEGADSAGCIEVIWWEPNESGGKGCWYNGFFEVKPTHWQPLPSPPGASEEDGR